MRKIELLAPARDLETARAAIDCGADAVYIGGPGFGARHAASNTVADIGAVCDYARVFGVRVYATLNTVVFDHELVEAGRVARELTGAGVDALIVQDMAFLRMGLAGVELHASTQTTNTSPGGVKFLQEAGFSRVILERGITLERIREIRAATDIELECFVHGAICVGFSGQCYLSRSMGPRSGNRGECSQPCRLTYDLLLDGKPVAEGKHLLSLRDLNLSGHIGQLLDAGVSSFKIEGRLKDANYVKNIVTHYRGVLDGELARRRGLVRSSQGVSVNGFAADPARTFTRGFTPYYVDGPTGGAASFDTPKAVGNPVGVVRRIIDGGFEIESSEALSPGDGICFIRGGELLGTNINRVESSRIYPNGACEFRPGDTLYRNFDHAFNTLLSRGQTRRRIKASALVGVDKNRVELTLSDASGEQAKVRLEQPFEPANNAQKMAETIKTQLSKSGGTVFDISDVEISGGPVPFIPSSTLNALRREAIDKLEQKLRDSAPQRNIKHENMSFPFPSTNLTGEANVTNRLAAKFYRDHGVTHIEPAFDLRDSLEGQYVMTTPYCIRREVGMCSREGGRKGEMTLRRGTKNYRLEFDCANCLMRLIVEK